jgi:hypothetical protein
MCRERDLLNTLHLICGLTTTCFFKKLFFQIFWNVKGSFVSFGQFFAPCPRLELPFQLLFPLPFFYHQVEYVEAM